MSRNLQKREQRERGIEMKTEQVRQRMKDMKISGAQMAEALGMDTSTYYRKMQKNGEKFSAVDLTTFKRVLDLDEKTALDFLLS